MHQTVADSQMSRRLSLHLCSNDTYEIAVCIVQFVWTVMDCGCGFIPLVLVGYGFVDFESPVDAQHAVEGLQATGILAQFARVGCSVCMCVRAYVCVCVCTISV